MATPLPLNRSPYSSCELHGDAIAFADLMSRRMLLQAKAARPAVPVSSGG